MVTGQNHNYYHNWSFGFNFNIQWINFYKKKCFKLCGCGSDGKCHYCNSNDYTGHIDDNKITNNDGPFETNGMTCSEDKNVSFILFIGLKKDKFET